MESKPESSEENEDTEISDILSERSGVSISGSSPSSLGPFGYFIILVISFVSYSVVALLGFELVDMALSTMTSYQGELQNNDSSTAIFWLFVSLGVLHSLFMWNRRPNPISGSTYSYHLALMGGITLSLAVGNILNPILLNNQYFPFLFSISGGMVSILIVYTSSN